MRPVTIKQCKSSRPSMGLEELGKSCFDGAVTTITIPKTAKGWLHGLDSEEVRIVERFYGRSFSNPNDDAFWAQQQFDLSHSGEQLDLDHVPDLLKVSLLKASGYLTSDPAKQHNYWFIIYDEAKETSLKAKLYESKNTAHSILKKLKATDVPYMIALARKMSGFTNAIKTEEGAFVFLYDFIDGEHSKNKSTSIQTFLDSVDPSLGGKVPKERTMVEAHVRTAIQYNIIRYNSTTLSWYNAALPQSDYGRSEPDIVDFMLKEGNALHLGTGGESDEPFAILRQIGAMNG